MGRMNESRRGTEGWGRACRWNSVSLSKEGATEGSEEEHDLSQMLTGTVWVL